MPSSRTKLKFSRKGLSHTLLALAFLMISPAASGAEQVAETSDKKVETAFVKGTPIKDDLIFKAMLDEQERTEKQLKLENHEKPYFVQYKVLESDSVYINAAYGSLSSSNRSKSRRFYPDIRVGNYDMDSSKDSGGLSSLLGGSFLSGGVSLPLEDDYYAIRHEIWLSSDKAYKKAIESFEAKKAELKANPVSERLGDLTKEKPVVYLKPSVALDFDRKNWEENAVKLSAIFLKHPEVEHSLVNFNFRSANAWLSNNEGFRHRDGQFACELVVSSSVRAKDGRQYSDSIVYAGDRPEDLPDLATMESGVKDMIGRLNKLASAPLAESYSGPILFSEEAAGTLMNSVLSKLLSGPSDSGEGSSLFKKEHPYRNQIGKRVASRMVTVVDDPSASDYKGTKLLGTFEVDDDGIPAQKLTLIEKGVLKTFCTSRVPVRGVEGSNGHSGNGVGTTSVLFVSIDPGMKNSKLKKKLLAIGKDEGYDHVYYVKRFAPAMGLFSLGSSISSLFSSLGKGVVLTPSELYKINVKNGKEELVRGAVVALEPRRVMREIVGGGDKEKAVLVASKGGRTVSVIVPSLLVRDLDIKEPSKQSRKPPIVSNPLIEKSEP